MVFSFKVKIVFIWFCLASIVQGMSHKIDRSFKVIFWGAELGIFKVKGEFGAEKYSVSTNASAKSLISFLSRFEISSGAIGKFDPDGMLIPIQSISRWRMRGKFRETKLNYRDGILIAFEKSPDLLKQYHISDPIGIENTIDPISLIFWLIIERAPQQICKQKLSIMDGFRISELSFE